VADCHPMNSLVGHPNDCHGSKETHLSLHETDCIAAGMGLIDEPQTHLWLDKLDKGILAFLHKSLICNKKLR
jgi:hypothetical protein